VNSNVDLTTAEGLAYGGFLGWVSMVQYLKYNSRYFVLVRTLRRGLPHVFRFFAGTLPIFVGFCIFGMVLFGDVTSRFDGMANSAVALFSVRCVHPGSCVRT
jgi:hypothetical protein